MMDFGIAQYLQEIDDLKKENEQLKQQIEKMKCCENCKYRYTESFPTQTEPCNKCLAYSHSKWEMIYD